jgi:hypothetical protein
MLILAVANCRDCSFVNKTVDDQLLCLVLCELHFRRCEDAGHREMSGFLPNADPDTFDILNIGSHSKTLARPSNCPAFR